jgi:hypothetical protein
MKSDEGSLKECELKDVFFLYVKFNPGASLEKIAEEHARQMDRLDIDKQGVYDMLSSLVADEKLTVSQEGGYKVHPSALYFTGFVINYLQFRKKERKKNKNELFLRVFPYGLTILFGASTIFFNLQSNKKDKELQAKTTEIDSLRKATVSLRQTIDSLRRHK